MPNELDKAIVLVNLINRNSVSILDVEDIVLQIQNIFPSIHYPIAQAEICYGLSRFQPDLLGKAVQYARNVDDLDMGKVQMLAKLSTVCPELFEEAFKIMKRMLNDTVSSIMIETFTQVSRYLPAEYIPEYIEISQAFPLAQDRAQALSSYLSRLPLHNLPYPDWQSHLHLLAHRKRADLMGDLVTLYPAILHLGGEGAMRGIVEEMKRVCEQWP